METLIILDMLRARARAWVNLGALEQDEHAVLEGFIALIEAAAREDRDQAFMVGRYGPGGKAGAGHAADAEPLPGM